MTPSITNTAQTTGCWTSFTTMCSSALKTLAAGVAKLWAMIKVGASSLYAALSPMAANAYVWATKNPQVAAVGGALAAVVAAASVYFCCCRSAAPTNPPATTATAAAPATTGAPATPATTGAPATPAPTPATV